MKAEGVRDREINGTGRVTRRGDKGHFFPWNDSYWELLGTLEHLLFPERQQEASSPTRPSVKTQPAPGVPSLHRVASLQEDRRPWGGLSTPDRAWPPQCGAQIRSLASLLHTPASRVSQRRLGRGCRGSGPRTKCYKLKWWGWCLFEGAGRVGTSFSLESWSQGEVWWTLRSLRVAALARASASFPCRQLRSQSSARLFLAPTVH